MSHHNYAYGPPEGHYQRQPDPSLPYPAYSAPSYHPSASETIPTYANEHATNPNAFDHNRNVIPGLGLGFSNPAPEWRQQWENQPAVALPVQNLDPGMMQRSLGTHTNNADSLASASRPTEAGAQDDAMDEGELSEGELEDIYEPKYPEHVPSSAGKDGVRNQALPTNGSGPVTKDPAPQDEPEPGLSGR